MSGHGCPCCCNRICIKDVNDVNTTNPEFTKYFKNKEDAYTVTIKSGKEIEAICPECKTEKNIKMSTLSTYGLACGFCSDGISIPEKFIMNLLIELNIEFIRQKSFNWSKNKKYDFFIPSLNIIIEAHGLQHYKDNNKFTNRRNLKEEQENDDLKEKLAKENGIENYIIIDCRESELEWLKNNCIKNLSDLFSLDKIEWNNNFIKCQRSLMIETCKLWDEGIKSGLIISKKLNITYVTALTYLKRGRDIGICSYDFNRNKPVINITTNMYFESETQASEYYDVSMISACCRGVRKTAGGYKWKFYREDDKNEKNNNN